MKIYKVVYILDGHQSQKTIEATSAGQAFIKLMDLFPEAELVKAYREGRFLDGYGYTEYSPPSNARPEPLPEEKLEQTDMDL